MLGWGVATDTISESASVTAQNSFISVSMAYFQTGHHAAMPPVKPQNRRLANRKNGLDDRARSLPTTSLDGFRPWAIPSLSNFTRHGTHQDFDQVVEGLATKKHLDASLGAMEQRLIGRIDEAQEELARIIAETIATPFTERFNHLEELLAVKKDVQVFETADGGNPLLPRSGIVGSGPCSPRASVSQVLLIAYPHDRSSWGLGSSISTSPKPERQSTWLVCRLCVEVPTAFQEETR
jgi:hypothetical protein